MQDMNVYLSMKYSSPRKSKGSKDGDEDFWSNNMVTTVIWKFNKCMASGQLHDEIIFKKRWRKLYSNSC